MIFTHDKNSGPFGNERAKKRGFEIVIKYQGYYGYNFRIDKKIKETNGYFEFISKDYASLEECKKEAEKKVNQIIRDKEFERYRDDILRGIKRFIK